VRQQQPSRLEQSSVESSYHRLPELQQIAFRIISYLPAKRALKRITMSSTRNAIAVTATAAITAVTSYWLYQSASQYGWDGTLRYIWEGDPYSPKVRHYMETLDKADESIKSQERLIAAIEEALERARLDSIDDTKTTKEIVKAWVANFRPKNLEKSLSQLDTELDKMAAKVDGILIADNSRVFQELKRRKKLISKQLVLAMERTDALLASYQILQEQSC
jgi:hypothetical protein